MLSLSAISSKTMSDTSQKDLKLGPSMVPGSTRVTLDISETGDIKLVGGKEKLAEQLVRAIVNDNTMQGGLGINSTIISPSHINTLVTLILRNFRQAQIQQTETVDPSCIGYAVYRYDWGLTSANFVKLTQQPTTWTHSDLELKNGFAYTYAVSKVYNNGFESAMLEQLAVTPSQFDANKVPVIGNYFVAIPGDQSVSVYVDFNRSFTADELLESISNILVQQDPSDPRRVSVSIAVVNYAGNPLSLSSAKLNVAQR